MNGWIEGIQNAIRYIEDNLTEELCIADISAKAYVSPFHFQRIFSVLCGFTVGEYIRQRRLSLAGEELSAGNMRVIDIAVKYGYDSQDSFSRAFTRFHGISPSAAKEKGARLKTFILTWGDTPRDLDSHLSGMVNGNSYHVYYGNKSYSYDGITIASLDWDDTSSYGPETITLTWTENNGNCSYYVYDFTNRGNSNSIALSYSSAKVVVYKGNTLLNTYNVPIGFSGTTWNVFSINNGDLTTINTIS